MDSQVSKRNEFYIIHPRTSNLMPKKARPKHFFQVLFSFFHVFFAPLSNYPLTPLTPSQHITYKPITNPSQFILIYFLYNT